MARRQSIGIHRELAGLIPTRQLNFLARLSGLVQRRRKVDPMALFWTVVSGFGAGRERTLAGLRRAYQQSTGATLVKLHDLLKQCYPACRTNHARAAAKLHLVMSVKGKGSRSVKLTARPTGVTGERF